MLMAPELIESTICPPSRSIKNTTLLYFRQAESKTPPQALPQSFHPYILPLTSAVRGVRELLLSEVYKHLFLSFYLDTDLFQFGPHLFVLHILRIDDFRKQGIVVNYFTHVHIDKGYYIPITMGCVGAADITLDYYFHSKGHAAEKGFHHFNHLFGLFLLLSRFTKAIIVLRIVLIIKVLIRIILLVQ